MDGNLKSMERYHDKMEKQEQAHSRLIDSFDDELCELKDQMISLIKRAGDFEGYDFEEEMKELIKELI